MPPERLIETHRGPVEVPLDPPLVVAVGTYDIPGGLDLGLPLVRDHWFSGSRRSVISSLLVDAFLELQRVTRLQMSPLNIEALASLRPDCIIDTQR